MGSYIDTRMDDGIVFFVEKERSLYERAREVQRVEESKWFVDFRQCRETHSGNEHD